MDVKLKRMTDNVILRSVKITDVKEYDNLFAGDYLILKVRIKPVKEISCSTALTHRFKSTYNVKLDVMLSHLVKRFQSQVF